MENVHKRFEKYNCDEYAKISYKILDWSNILQLFMKKEIQLWSMWQNFCWRMLFESVHENNFEFNCDQCGKNFTKAFINQTKHWIEITNYSCSWKKKSILINGPKILKEDAIWMIMKLIHELNCEHLLFWIWN